MIDTRSMTDSGLTGRVTAADAAEGDADVFQFDIPLVALTVHIRQGVHCLPLFFSEYVCILNYYRVQDGFQ